MKQKQLSSTILASSIGALLLSTASSAFAQAPTPPTVTPPDINRATPPARDGARRITTLGQGTISLCPFASSTIPVTINKVVIDGSSVLSQADIDRSYAAIRGQPTTLSALCGIRERLILDYRGHGFPLTRVELPEQRIGADGTIRFHAVEAGLASVQVRDDGKAPAFSNVLNGYVDALKGDTVGKPLKWAEVERFALLMRDTPGLVARLELRPGAAAPAAEATPAAATTPAVTTAPPPVNITPSNIAPLDLFVTLEPPSRFNGFVSVQRNSADVFGRYAGVIGGSVSGVMPWGGDQLSGVLYSTQTGRQAVGQVAYEWHHSSGLQLKASAAYAETKPGKTFAPLDLKGQSSSYNVNASYPFILRSAVQVEGVVGLDYIDQDNFIFSDQSISNDKVRVVSVKSNMLWRDVQERRAHASATVEYRKGIDSFDASKPGDPFLSRIGANPQAELWRVRGEGEFRYKRNYPGIGIAADVQIADDTLVSFEQYQVGNLTFGRGYDPGTITGDRGYGGRIELLGGRYSARGYDQFQVEPYLGYDTAHVENLGAAAIDPKRTVNSFSGGLRFRYADKVSFDIGGAQAQDVPGLNQKKPGPQFLMNLTIQF